MREQRKSTKLLAHLQIKKPLIYLREASRASDVKRIIELHKQGKTVAVTTDAGMPGISDPGAYLVRERQRSGNCIHCCARALRSVHVDNC